MIGRIIAGWGGSRPSTSACLRRSRNPKYGFDAAAGGAEALSSRTGVQGYTIRRAGLLEAIFPLRAVALSGGSVPGQTRSGFFGQSRLVGWLRGSAAAFGISDELSEQSRTPRLRVPFPGRHMQESLPVMSTLVLEPQTWENTLRRTEQKSTPRSQMEFVAIG